jgi:ankyrin repeat protein
MRRWLLILASGIIVIAITAIIWMIGCVTTSPLANHAANNIAYSLQYTGISISVPELRYQASPLHYAARSNDTAKIKRLLLQGAEINAKDTAGQTALFYAANKHNLEAVKLLVAAGADVKSASLAAVSSTAVMQFLLEHGAKPDVTALNNAVNRNSIEQVKLLLKYGANPQQPIADYSPLQSAVLQKNPQIAKLLLANGSLVDSPSKFGERALHLAINTGDVNTISLLIKNGANVNVLPGDQTSPLNTAMRVWSPSDMQVRPDLQKDSSSAKDDYDRTLPIIKLLISKGARVNDGDKYGERPLHIAAIKHSPTAVLLLIQYGAKIDAIDKKGNAALHYAAGGGKLQTCQFLIQHGADPNKANNEGRTPLLSAAGTGHLDIIKMLLERGVNVWTRDKRGWTALHYIAAIYPRSDNVQEATLLLSHGADVNARDKTGRTPLSYAVEFGTFDMVKALLAKGAAVDLADNTGQTPLQIASMRGVNAPDMLKLLLDHGADVNHADAAGVTVWQAAQSNPDRNKRRDIITLLQARGAKK